MATVRAAAVQFFSGPDIQANLDLTTRWVEVAARAGAQLVVTPENSNRERDFFANGKPSKEVAWDRSETLDGVYVTGIRALAKRLGIYLVCGVDYRGEEKPSVYIGMLLIGPTGDILNVHHKTVLWDYEYTLFTPGTKPLRVVETPVGVLGLHSCADQIVPDVPRTLALLGAEVFCNSLNSRGPDERRVHIPLRAIENGVWHVAANTVGNPNNTGLLWPWTGGSQIVSPTGKVLDVASENDYEGMAIGNIVPAQARKKDNLPFVVPHLFKWRRPELYGILGKPKDALPVTPMYGPVDPSSPAASLKSIQVAMCQLSQHHTRTYMEWATKLQITYAARRSAQLCVFPELFCFKRGEVGADPSACAAYSLEVLSQLKEHAKAHNVGIATSLVECNSSKYYHTAYLIEGGTAKVSTYRKTHLSRDENEWATQGDTLSEVFDCGNLGKIAFMLGDEVWLPEVARCLALAGAETILHPCDWDRAEACNIAAVERVSENRVHIVSMARLDNHAEVGSQVCFAGEFIGGEPIPLMRYPQALWQRYGVEEQLLVEIKRREAHCKMMGYHLDVLNTRCVDIFGPMHATS